MLKLVVRVNLDCIPSVSRVDFWRRDPTSPKGYDGQADHVPFRAAWGQAGSTED